MSGDELGAGRCEQCGGPITGKGRRDRKYCSASCRTLAWNERAGREPGKASSRVAATQLDEGLVDRLAAALALRFAQGDAASAAKRPEPQPATSTPVGSAEFEAIKQLQSDMAKLRTELELSRASSTPSTGSQHATAKVLTKDEGQSSPPSQHQVTGQSSGTLPADRQGGGIAADETASRIEQLKASYKQKLAAKAADHERLSREYVTLLQAHNRLDEALEKAKADNQSLTVRNRELEQQCEAAKSKAEALRKELLPLRKVLSEEDPLLFVMHSQVSLMHRIAVRRESIGSNRLGRRLPDEKPETRQSAAVYAAYAARQQYFAKHANKQKDTATWVVEGRRLDSVSEQSLRRQEEQTLEELEHELSHTTRLREGR